MSTMGLTQHDSIIFRSLLDIDPQFTDNPGVRKVENSTSRMDENEFQKICAREKKILLQLNVKDPCLVTIKAALQELTEIIERHPHHASAYNNRAQTRRLLIPVDKLFRAEEEINTQAVLADLASSIALATQVNQDETTSQHQRRVLSAAYSHQGHLFLRAADIAREGENNIRGLLRSDLDAAALEELASQSFAAAGVNGSNEAKDLAVKTNPYARMCGAMVKTMLAGEYGLH